MTLTLPRWLRREPVQHGHGRHALPLAPSSLPGAAPALVAATALSLTEPEPAAPPPEALDRSPEEPSVPMHLAGTSADLADVAPDADLPVPAAETAEPVTAPAFDPPPWDLPAPAAPPVPATEADPGASTDRVPRPVALEFSDGARVELDEHDPRVASFLAAAAAVAVPAGGVS
jgi:hypothetical protein